MTFQELQPKVTEIIKYNTFKRRKTLSLELLSNSIDYYNWVDFILQITIPKHCT
jgi:hypothetical protein